MDRTTEAETAITKLNIYEQDYYRHIVANNIKQLTMNKLNDRMSKEEWNTIKHIKESIVANGLIITKAYKGKTVVIIELQKYQQYIQEFINEKLHTIITGSHKAL
jgi:hypothetical protein